MITSKQMLCIGVAMACITPAFAQQTDTAQAPPPAGPPRPFQLPTPVTITLDNGIKATFVDFGVVPKVSIAISVRSGGLNEGDRVWLSDLTGDLLKEGTRNRNAEQ